MCINTQSISLVILPLSVVDIAIDVGELAEARRFTFLPMAFVHCAVGPPLLAVAVPHVSLPLAEVLGTTGELVGLSLLPLERGAISVLRL